MQRGEKIPGRKKGVTATQVFIAQLSSGQHECVSEKNVYCLSCHVGHSQGDAGAMAHRAGIDYYMPQIYLLIG